LFRSVVTYPPIYSVNPDLLFKSVINVTIYPVAKTVHGSLSARLLNVLALLDLAPEDFTCVIRNSMTISTVLVQCKACLRMLQPLPLQGRGGHRASHVVAHWYGPVGVGIMWPAQLGRCIIARSDLSWARRQFELDASE
jgi:hypothetical protein